MSLKATRAVTLGLFLFPGLATVAVAEPSTHDGDRFTMSPVDGGFLRLDKQTGAVAMCAKSSNDWACKPVADQTANSPADKFSRLELENRDLKDRVKELEKLLETRPLGAPRLDGPESEGPPGGKAQLPTDEEVDQALDYMSRIYKKIREHIKDLNKSLPPDEQIPQPPTPPVAPAPKGSL